MPIHLERDLEQLKKAILTLGAMVESATDRAILALTDRRLELAEEVIVGDRAIDDREIKVEGECLKILALHQPVANDLRYVIAMLKVNSDLERVGDLAGNVAERAATLIRDHEAVAIPPQIHEMGVIARAMLRDSLNALIHQNTELARKVLDDDEEVDRRHKEIYGVLQARMKTDPQQVDTCIPLMSVSRYLERIADMATNIAEDVVFMVDGEVIRHRPA
ncbi:MAG: phosphate signaling complex protein PhoU [Thermoanaerobaculia bacterium]|nr:phosphate signaling complex protein PhoU [Thermoanaerobaculia bacterium]